MRVSPGLIGEIDRVDVRLRGLDDRRADRHAAGAVAFTFALPSRPRQEEIQRAAVRIVPGGLAVVREDVGLVDRHLPAGRLEQDHVLRDFGVARLLRGVVDVEREPVVGDPGGSMWL